MIIAQISDPHISVAGAQIDRAFATAAHLERAVVHLLRLPTRPDVVLITGDCVNGGGETEYARFRDLIAPLTMPVYLVPDNVDDRGLMREMFGPQGTKPMTDFVQYVVEDWPIRLIALDTHVPGSDAGRLCAERLSWLEARLAEAPERPPTVLFMHHPPFATYLPPLDAISLAGADKLGEIVARYGNVERILTGHVHRAVQRRFFGSLAMTCPSTAHQFPLDLQRSSGFAAVMEPSACLLHVWHDDTGLVTHMSMIGDYGPVVELE